MNLNIFLLSRDTDGLDFEWTAFQVLAPAQEHTVYGVYGVYSVRCVRCVQCVYSVCTVYGVIWSEHREVGGGGG